MTEQQVNDLAASLSRTATFDDDCNPRTPREAALYAEGIETMRMNLVRMLRAPSGGAGG